MKLRNKSNMAAPKKITKLAPLCFVSLFNVVMCLERSRIWQSRLKHQPQDFVWQGPTGRRGACTVR